ncbi:protein kinase domain-containing protein [Actinomadura decatromicini]|uniref:Protein kinase n=1 Tax=Actinomadura decatromicini TaxID=2604572 RepID=A0A5D3FRF4_9ACTN|nr:peptidylprolyl isomerase [Actinomadura decatromicini]TYK50813.1 protein kinase [Actinomadura decatromicini]
MPEPRPLRPNDPRELGGFRLTARIGEGAQGTVFLGESADGQRVAAKLLHADIGRDERARTLFERELAAVRRVAPFCTARVLAADADGDLPYIVSEYIEGPSLRELVAERGAASGEDLVRLAIGTATALAAIHEAGVVHRDLKPANVLLGADGPKVIDFGIARPLDATSATMTGAVGTPAYMAPEQFAGSAGGAPLDMFAWGCTMAFAANGVPPFGADTVPAIMQRVLTGEPDLGALTGDLRGLVAACLAKDPASRPTAVQVLRGLLGDRLDAAAAGTERNLLAEGTSVAGRRPSAPPPPAFPAGPPPVYRYPTNPAGAPRPGRGRHAPLIAVGAWAGVLAVAGGVVGVVLWNDREKPATPATQSSPGSRTALAGQSSRNCVYTRESLGGVKDVGTPPSQVPATLPTRATIKTNRGTLQVRLDAAKAPCTVNSLAFLAGKKYYDDTPCHRLTTSAGLKVLQCGDPSGRGSGGPGYKFANENTSGARYTRGVVAMANAGPDTNGSQFFILYADATLSPDYTPFGQVTSGLDMVDEVAKAGAGDENGPGDGTPKRPVTITEFRTT